MFYFSSQFKTILKKDLIFREKLYIIVEQLKKAYADYYLTTRRVVRVAEGAALEMLCTYSGTEGSNPSLYAKAKSLSQRGGLFALYDSFFNLQYSVTKDRLF